MPIISLTLPDDGDYIVAADYNTPLGIIQDLLNGNLDSDNIEPQSLNWSLFNTSSPMPSSLLSGANNGWFTVSDSWTYASATTITVPSDATLVYQVGMPVCITQSSTVKYGWIVKVASTVLTVSPLNDSSLNITSVANSAISSIKVGLSGSMPLGFPDWMKYTCAWTSNSSAPAVGNASFIAKFKINGRQCLINIYIAFGSTTTYGSGNYRFSLPLTSKNENKSTLMNALATDLGTRTYIGEYVVGGNATVGIFENSADGQEWGQTTPFTFGNGDLINITGGYEYDS